MTRIITTAMTFRLLSYFILIILFASSCSKDRIEGDGNLARLELDLEEYDKIFNSSTIDIKVVNGSSFKATIQGDSNIIAAIQLRVSGEELEIDPNINFTTSISLELDLVVPKITSIVNEGTGNIKGNTVYENLTIENSGTGNIELTGQSVEEVMITNEGTGAILMYGLGAEDMTIENSGTGDSFVFVSKSLDVTVSGTGNVYYRGRPDITSDLSGIGQLIDSN